MLLLNKVTEYPFISFIYVNTYMYRSKPEILRFQPIPPFIFPLQFLLNKLNFRFVFDYQI